ncbi:hypothetical protein [Streptomyces sp. NPDC057426]|uniref:hypothetical protein n=1 Tax=Streptomyces sp. NPDC057426 TaxID=3346128 RepID=UPI00368FD37F
MDEESGCSDELTGELLPAPGLETRRVAAGDRVGRPPAPGVPGRRGWAILGVWVPNVAGPGARARRRAGACTALWPPPPWAWSP